MRGLFINNKKAKDSIYESGYMAYQCLLLSDQYSLDYIEIDIDNRQIPVGYDFYFFNYHPATMRWLDTKPLKKELGFVMTMVLEVAPNDPFVLCPKNDFAVYCALDPTIKINDKRVYAFPRPLEKINFDLPVADNPIPVIGSFGFATKGKGFQHVVEAVNKEFEKAIVRINIPFGDFVPDSKEYAFFLGDLCRKKAKEGITVEVTHDFMSKEELIKWCAANTLNCFLYDRDMQGLSATTDQAIITGRPLAISDNNTFRHIAAYLPVYPKWSLKESIERSVPYVLKMRQDWQGEQFAKRFELLLKDFPEMGRNAKKENENYDLPILKEKKDGTIMFLFKQAIKVSTYKRLIAKYTQKKVYI